MINIRKYQAFLEEVFMRDIWRTKSTSDSEMENRIKSHIGREFNFDGNLTGFVKVDGKKKIKVYWNDSESHSIKKRIKERTSFVSIREFNKALDETIRRLFIEKIEEIDKKAKYCIKCEKFALSLLISLDPKKDNLSITSILPYLTTADGVYKTILL